MRLLRIVISESETIVQGKGLSENRISKAKLRKVNKQSPTRAKLYGYKHEKLDLRTVRSA